jgi:predicted MFS family arabinose efflux permease
VSIGAGLGIFGTDALAIFLVPYAVDVGFGEASAGVLLAVASVSGILMRVVAGWRIDRTASTSLATVAVFMALGGVGIAAIAVGTPVAVIAGSFLAFTLGWGWSGLFTFSVVRRNPRQPAAATGIAMTGIYVGAATGPVVFGIVAERISFTVGWVAMAAALALGALLMLLAVVRERA